MTVDEMIALTEQGPVTMLVIPRTKRSTGQGIRLLGDRGPVGDILTAKVKKDKTLEYICTFNSAKLRKFLMDNRPLNDN